MATLTLSDTLLGYQTKRNKIQNMQDIESSMNLWIEELINQEFEYKGLPKEIPFDVIERVLFYYGMGVMFKVGENLFFLPCSNTGDINIYGRPTQVQAIGLNGQSYVTPINIEDKYDENFNLINKCDGVLFLNNEQGISTQVLIRPYINRLMYLWQSIGINECLNRTRAILHCNKDISKVAKEQFTQIFEGANPIVILNDKGMSQEKEMTLDDFNTPYIANEIWVDFDNTLNKLLSIIGIKNINTQKKERLVSSETSATDELVNDSLNSRLDYRKNAVERANSLFGINLQVNRKQASIEPKTELNEDKEKTDKLSFTDEMKKEG